MPIFKFKCEDCGNEFEKLLKGSDKKIKCEKCGSEKTEKQLSTFSAKVNDNSSCSTCCPTGSCGL